MRRDWRAALAAHAGKGCRECGHHPRQLAHVLPRKFDRPPRAPRTAVVRVDPRAVVPLCKHHHALYDSHQFDLWPLLSPDELEFAVSRVGEGEAIVRIRGRTAGHAVSLEQSG